MFYEKRVTVPANTAKKTPVVEGFALVEGTVHYVEILFPPGCVQLVHVQLWEPERQVWPTNLDGDFADNATSIRFSDAYEITNARVLWSVRAWNEDTEYPHTITVRIGVLDKQQLFPLWTLFQTLNTFFKIFRIREELLPPTEGERIG